jgi:hypothetical protein
MTDTIDSLRAQLSDMTGQLEARDEALLRIRQWCDAYPVEVFTPLTDKEVEAAVVAANGAVRHGSVRLHASWARHILDGVRKYAELKP